MKVFEGLKVSIPTQDLNLQEVLKCSSAEKEEIPTTEEIAIKEQEEKAKKKDIFKKFGNKLGLRETKKKNTKKSKNILDEIKSHDIYDFEESEDNSSLFKNKSLTVFRNIKTVTTVEMQDKPDIFDNMIDSSKPVDDIKRSIDDESNVDTESETDRYYDSVSFEENSLSSESVEQTDEIKLKVASEKSLSKKDDQKKCMIMGRIFKNASKPKLEDKIPEIRDISSEENSKMIENYLDSYSSLDNIETAIEGDSALPGNNLMIINTANKMTKHEMDFLFDKLLNENQGSPVVEPEMQPETKIAVPEKVEEVKHKEEKEKPKAVKPKKRQRHHSDDSASTDEFTLSGRQSKSSKKHKKHPRKVNPKKQNGGINLEQEIKECIGVAGRKSQRKCTSGKQNVLVEFWSSDESIDYALLCKPSDVPAKTAETEITPENQTDVIPDVSLSVENLDEKVTDNKNVPLETKDLYEFEPDLDEIDDPIMPLTHQVPLEKHKLEKLKKVMKAKPDFKKVHSKEESDLEMKPRRKSEHKKKRNSNSEGSNVETVASTRRKRSAVETLYYWSSTSDDDLEDLIEVKPIREDTEDDRPMQHGWIVGDSPKKLVTMLAQAKGNKKVDCESVKEQSKKTRTTL